MLNSTQLRSSSKVVGYWFNEKKSQKFGATELADACRKRNMDFIKIDLEDDLTHPKFDAILHKLTALYAPALAGDQKAQELVKRIEKFVNNNPQITVIDPLPSIQSLLLRVDTYLLLEDVTRNEEMIFTPSFVTLTKDKLEDLDTLLKTRSIIFPVVCKPLLAGGSKDAHEMELVFNKKSLENCSLPCVGQSFINHNAVLYKLFVLGTRWFVTLRPSLKNFYAGDRDSIVFNSHQISKPDSCSPLTHCDEIDPGQKPKADLLVLERIASLIRSALNSDLLGIDVVIDRRTGRYGIIDVNPFPSFDSIPDVMEHLADTIRDRIDSSPTHSSASPLTFHLSLGMDQSYFQQELSRPETIKGSTGPTGVLAKVEEHSSVQKTEL